MAGCALAPSEVVDMTTCDLKNARRPKKKPLECGSQFSLISGSYQCDLRLTPIGRHTKTSEAERAFQIKAVQRAAKGESLVLQAAHRSIGHTGGRMACLSNAPVLILAAENATTPAIAMAVRTAAAQRGCRRGDRHQTQGDKAEQGSRRHNCFQHRYSFLANSEGRVSDPHRSDTRAYSSTSSRLNRA